MADKNKAQEIGDGIADIGKGLMGCGCLITIIAAIIIVLIL